MSQQLGIVDILKSFGFEHGLRSRLVRHQSSNPDISKLMSEGWFEVYQSLQKRPVFRGCEQLVSFVGDGPGRARLVGVYRVLNEGTVTPLHLPENCPYKAWGTESKFHYQLQYQPQYDDLVGRVVIEWSSELAWHQHTKNNPVVEIFPKGRALPPFSDYLDFSLSHRELKSLFDQPKAHRDWSSSLSAVSGVYLILAQQSGNQYVGSAYGTAGIWGRWKQYAAKGHGNNVMLQALMQADKRYPDDFLYSILQILPKSTTPAEVIRWEGEYKKKLGSRAIGLNQSENRSQVGGIKAEPKMK